jgi:hypothetical protein
MVLGPQEVAELVGHDQAIVLWLARVAARYEVDMSDMGDAVDARDLAASETDDELAGLSGHGRVQMVKHL